MVTGVKKKAIINKNECVACGACMKKCPKSAITIPNGICALVDINKCVGCGICAKTCPASVIIIGEI